MPGARRVRKGQTGRAPNSQIKSGGVSAGAPDSYDGRETMRRNEPTPPKPDYQGPGVVVKTK